MMIAMLAISLIACKKEDDVSVAGYWTGTVLETGSSTPSFAGFLYASSNTVKSYLSGSDSASAPIRVNGTYSIDPDSVRTTITDGVNTTLLIGKLSNSNNKMDGTYRSLTNSAKGTFSITRN